MNFDIPYAATDPRDFWRRWHITLSEWLRDYLYIPLGGSRGSPNRIRANLMITMALGGLWHGARWHFVVWGLYHGVLLIAHRAFRGRPDAVNAGGTRRAFSMLAMFHLTCLGWILFRAQSMADLSVIGGKLFTDWGASAQLSADLTALAAYSGLMILLQVMQYRAADQLVVFRWPTALRAALYVVMYCSLTLAGAYDGPQFLYFQF